MKKELLRMEGICKSFYENKVLKGVSFNLFEGETLAIIGENGAGKSTLVRILCGLCPMERGRIYLGEAPAVINSAQDARRRGIHFIMQDPSLVPEFTVSENIFLFYSCDKNKVTYNRSEVKKIAKELLLRLGIDLDPDKRAEKLTMSQQFLLEIAMAVSTNSKVLVMDETTAALNHNDVENVKRIIEEYKKKGNGVIFISHNIEEVLDIADRTMVMRDGMSVGHIKKRDYNKSKIIKLLVGKEVPNIYHRGKAVKGTEVLRLENVCTEQLKNISFSLCSGEILGITGLIGSGKSRIAGVAFGLEQMASGNILLYKRRVKKLTASMAVKKRIAFIPEDKQALGLLPNMSPGDNIVITILEKLGRGGVIRDRIKRFAAGESVKKLKIQLNSRSEKVSMLSGGNQQKVIIARWLARGPKIIIADEPTTGLDINSKIEVYKLLDALARKGVAVLLICSHIPEILQMSDRVLVMDGGMIKGELENDEITKESIIELEIN